MVHRATSLATENAQRMSLIHIDHRAVTFRHGNNRGKVGDIAGHAENPIQNNHPTGLIRQTLEAIFQRLCGIVAEGNELRWSELAPIDDARMVFTIAKDRVPIFGQRNECTLVCKKTRRIENGSLPPKKSCQRLLELHMQLDSSVEQTRPRAPRTIATGGITCRLDDAGILSQTEVVIRSDHDLLFPLANHVIAVGFLNRTEVGVETLGARIRAVSVVPALLIKIFGSGCHRWTNQNLQLLKACKSISHWERGGLHIPTFPLTFSHWPE